MQADYLVLGSGIAGLTYAIKVSEKNPDAKVVVLSKGTPFETNTSFAQGGLAAVTDFHADSFALHAEDTKKAGDGLCDAAVVDFFVREAPGRLNDLLNWGASFDRRTDGSFHLAREGGHKASRIIHAGDHTGREIQSVLVKKAMSLRNVTLLGRRFAIDLNVEDGRCFGVTVLNLDSNVSDVIYSTVTMLATGGVGAIYAHTTNPAFATGDGIAMARRAGAIIQGMEFIQFHPTAFFDHSGKKQFLISEAVRGAGARLLNANGHRFMYRYDDRGELASRDIVSRGINAEMEKTGSDCVYLDCRHIPGLTFKNHFPTILRMLSDAGLHPSTDLIPVSPAAHYCCGGINTDYLGRTTIAGLYAAGECAHTGLHGANRLASNSLTEALVFAARAAEDSTRAPVAPPPFQKAPASTLFSSIYDEWLIEAKSQIRVIMWSVAIETSGSNLLTAQRRLNELRNRLWSARENSNINYAMVNNMLDVASLIVEASVKRRDNKGVFFRKSDIPVAQLFMDEINPD